MRPLQGTGNRLRLSLIQRPRPPPPLPTPPTVSRTLLLSSSTKFLKRSQGEKKKKKKRFFQYVKHWHGHNKTWPVWRQPEEGRFVSPGMLLSAHENQSPVYTDATKAANVPTSTLALQSTMSLFYSPEGTSSAMRREGSSREPESLGSNTSSATYLLCGLGQVTYLSVPQFPLAGDTYDRCVAYGRYDQRLIYCPLSMI